jgi:hypothetical protein
MQFEGQGNKHRCGMDINICTCIALQIGFSADTSRLDRYSATKDHAMYNASIVVVYVLQFFGKSTRCQPSSPKSAHTHLGTHVSPPVDLEHPAGHGARESNCHSNRGSVSPCSTSVTIAVLGSSIPLLWKSSRLEMLIWSQPFSVSVSLLVA